MLNLSLLYRNSLFLLSNLKICYLKYFNVYTITELFWMLTKPLSQSWQWLIWKGWIGNINSQKVSVYLCFHLTSHSFDYSTHHCCNKGLFGDIFTIYAGFNLCVCECDVSLLHVCSLYWDKDLDHTYIGTIYILYSFSYLKS